MVPKKRKQLNSPSLLNTHALRQLPGWQDTQKICKKWHSHVCVCCIFTHIYLYLDTHVLTHVNPYTYMQKSFKKLKLYLLYTEIKVGKSEDLCNYGLPMLFHIFAVS